jgi:hypothetical protein
MGVSNTTLPPIWMVLDDLHGRRFIYERSTQDDAQRRGSLSSMNFGVLSETDMSESTTAMIKAE